MPQAIIRRAGTIARCAGVPAALALSLSLSLLLPLMAHADSGGVQTITAQGQAEMLKDPGVDVEGSAHADLTVVEFFDYRCPYCRKFAPVLESWLKQDGRGAVIFKEWPILGDVSVYASRAALASRWQGRYLPAHAALMKADPLQSDADVDTALRRAGVDLRKLKAALHDHGSEIDALLERNDQEAHALSLKGTPGIVVGRLLLPGIVDESGFQQVVAVARAQH